MLTIFINLFLAVCLACVLWMAHVAAPVWSVVWGVVFAVAFQVGVGLLLRRKMKRVTDEIQQIMMGAQRKMQAKMAQWQHRPPSSPKEAQQEMERDQRAAIAQALQVVEKLGAYNKWIPLLNKQTDTMRMQFCWQLKEFDKVDLLMPRAMLADPMLMSVKLARMYMKDAPTEELAKQFKKFTSRIRYGQGELLYGAYAWMLLKRGDVDGALKVLIDAETKMESATLKGNRAHLANNRPNHFSLTGLGDSWYALWLEEPKVRQQRMNPRHANRYF